MTIDRIVSRIIIFGDPPDRNNQEFIFRRNTKKRRNLCAICIYSDAITEVITPHRRNTRQQLNYIPAKK